MKDLKARTKKFALDIVQVAQALPRDRVTDVIGKQLLRSGTSVAANYRAACRARSQADFLYKLGIVEEEADETQFWLELLTEAKLVQHQVIEPLLRECDELVAITVSSIKTAKAKG